VATSRERAANLGNARFVCADAATWQPGADFAPSQLISRHGVMFFTDPVAAFANLASIAADGADLVFSCFRDPAHNPFLTEAMRLLPEAPPPQDPTAPGPFAFADDERVGGILTAAGWRDVAFEKVDFPMITGAGEDPIADAVTYFSRIGPASRVVATMDQAARATFEDRLRGLAQSHCSDGIVSLPAAAWIVRARRG
jgi:hypothetical protein